MDGISTADARKNLAELIIAKQRNGPTGTVKLEFEGRFAQFRDWPLSDNPYEDAPGADFAGGVDGPPPPLPDDGGYGGPDIFGADTEPDF